MKKFYVLLKKEVKELITPQVILPLIITVILFGFIGNVLGKEQEKITKQKQDVYVLDKDQSTMSNVVIDTLASANLNVNKKDNQNINNLLSQAKKENVPAILVIPEGFGQSIQNLEPKQIELYSILKNFSFTGAKSYELLSVSLSSINNALSDELIKEKTTDDPEKLKNIIKTNDFVVIGDKQANTNPAEVMNFVSSQSTFIPIILFIVIVFAAQMIATTIASEKENKTLETLLTTPVKRNYLVVSKMAGAGIIALASSLVYMFGFRNYMNSLTGDITSKMSDKIGPAIDALGLSFSTSDYAILALSLFFGILAALAIALILGAFAEDVKGVAGLTSPLMILVAIPYFLTMFLDISSLSPAVKYLVYAIPFSYSFMTAPNLILGNYAFVFFGILYQLIFFLIFVYIATKIFNTDKIITMKLNFGRRK